jgi:zinc protease
VQTAIREELVKLLKDGLTQAELDAARDGYLQAQAVGRTEDPALARVLDDTSLANRTMQYYADLEKKIQALTPEEVAKTFAKNVSAEKLFIAVAGDFRKDAKSSGGTDPGKPVNK